MPIRAGVDMMVYAAKRKRPRIIADMARPALQLTGASAFMQRTWTQTRLILFASQLSISAADSEHRPTCR